MRLGARYSCLEGLAGTHPETNSSLRMPRQFRGLRIGNYIQFYARCLRDRRYRAATAAECRLNPLALDT